MEDKNEGKKILILCVDRDDDIGRITGENTPIIGKERNLKVAVKFAVNSPEDSDVNAIFAAIGVYNKLRAEGINCEVATIAGSPEGGLKADMKILEELEEVINHFSASGVILVSDGAADEAVIPIIQSKLPIISVKRILIQQERSVEETYIVIARYLRKIVEEPQYARIFLGIPGAIFLLLAILSISGYAQYTMIGALIIIGSAFTIRGFSIDRVIMQWWKSSPIIFFSGLMTSITIIVSLYEGARRVLSELSIEPAIITNIPKMIGLFLIQSMDIFLIGIGILIVGRMIDKYLGEKRKIWHDFVGLVFLITVRPLLQNIALLFTVAEFNQQTLIYSIITTAGINSSLIVIFTLIDKIRERRARREEKSEERS